MTKSVLDRQSSLIQYLTSGSAIFGDVESRGDDTAPEGIDPHLLGIEARFSFEKRMSKIAAVFSLTLDLLGASRDALVRKFVDACPPSAIGRLENARQFHDFLATHWRHLPATPPYLPDVAACEFAFAAARALARDPSADEEQFSSRAGSLVRRSPAVVLLRAEFGRGGRRIVSGDVVWRRVASTPASIQFRRLPCAASLCSAAIKGEEQRHEPRW